MSEEIDTLVIVNEVSTKSAGVAKGTKQIPWRKNPELEKCLFRLAVAEKMWAIPAKSVNPRWEAFRDKLFWQ
jgi:hypothetical protein